MRRIVRIISLALVAGGGILTGYGQSDPVVQRMFLVGDAGELRDGHHPVCDWLKQHVDWNDSSNVLVYLGDNIYPHGMPADGAADLDMARRILDYQVSVVAGKAAKAFFVPGNHDWKQGKIGGWQQERNEEAYINGLGMPNVRLLPGDGCPGPVAVPLGNKMVLVCMDSQWWLQEKKERPGPQSACDCNDPKSIVNGLRDIVSLYPDRLIVLAMHHPFYTHGEHGGYYTLKQHIFPLTDLKPGLYIPLPVIGSIYPVSRGVFGNVQDTRNPRYKEMRDALEEVIHGHSNIVHVAGHEHTLQLLQHDSVYYVVSGAGSKNTRVKMGANSLMAREEIGFATIELHASGKSEIRFYNVGAGGLDQSFYSAAVPQLLRHVDTTAIVRNFPDSVTAVGDPEFLAGGFKRWLLGPNYRKEWAAPIKVKVFDMTGWTPLQRGGGSQTRSLRILAPDGKQYVLRGVKKYVDDRALPEAVQGDAFVRDIVNDGVSASYPYACLSIPPLAQALGVPHATPRLVYIPDDPRLGRFRADYGNLFAFLEEHEPGNGKKTYNMWDLERLLKEDNDNVIDQQATLRARMLDMFVMDFDRHEDQWRWMAVDNGKGKTLSPVPRDRDQPFFINNGFLSYIVGSAWAVPQLQGFRAKARNIIAFNYAPRNFDRNYLNELGEKEWRDMAEEVVATMTDTLIGSALRLQPSTIRGYSLDWIIAQLKERRKYFVGEMMKYYTFLSKSVSIYGSDKRELFDVERRNGDSVIVNVYKLSKEGNPGKRLYSRSFASDVTGEIRLYGQGGDDQFHIHGEEGGRTIVRIIGGPGNDDFRNEVRAPAGKTRIYDLNTEKNSFEGTGAERKFLSASPSVNEVVRMGYVGNSGLGYHYNVLAPLLSFAYNPDDGVFIGAGFRYTTNGFHKDPYKTLQIFTAEHSLSTKAYAFKYSLEAIKAIGSLDLLVNARVLAPNNTINFFGFGNESGFDKHTKEGIRYYRARYNSYDLDVQLRKRFGSVFSFSAGPAVQYFKLDSTDNFDRFVNQTAVNGLDASQLYRDRAYAGGRATVVIDDRNDKLFPSRGILWETKFGSYGGLNDASREYSQLNTDLALYTSFNTRANFVIANRVGWGKSFGNYEFYQAQTLGALENLRGYRKDRFTGGEAFYHNIDLRIKLAEFNTYLFPGSFGMVLFNDVGRVWQAGETSRQWHDGYGGGFWISPLSRLVFSASYGQGTDGGVVLVKLGFQY
ncbi:MAG TPA: BamA/TamA family outer membrane protein [Puia sp.]|uniref:BamA/TamA family outer membrane protein n=1 Tax=Puia sp. TaxID=2045100 RepID=UPI002BDA01AB|nr:BamA/TamA family outer membrane protein [Puia sp.]HVU94987.1 BamA/TamA family outer membrane protein [Puia sp.]